MRPKIDNYYEVKINVVQPTLRRKSPMQWFFGILLTAVLLVMTPGYGSAQPAEGKTVSPSTQPKAGGEKQAATKSVKSYTPKERQAYQQKVAADLDKQQQKIDNLHENYETVRSQMKRTTIRILHDLKKQLFAAQNQLAALKKAPVKDWSSLKDGMDKAMTELTEATKEAESRLQ
jgi:hypothetical protein